MIKKIIEFSLKNQVFIFLIIGIIFISSLYVIPKIPVDAIPDLSEVQVIIFTEYPGQSPQIVEDQITYPLTSAMLSVPYAKTVRGFSMFGFSMIYVIFEEGTDLYYARSRVLEYLNYANRFLPKGVTPQIGPDATGVGWVYMYILKDQTGTFDLQQLRSFQDWFLRYEFLPLEGVSEVAPIGGFIKQYYVEPIPYQMQIRDVELKEIQMAIEQNNIDKGGGLIEMGETEFITIGKGYIQSLLDLKNIPIKGNPKEGNVVNIGNIANVYIGPSPRRGIAEWNGEGEVVGGIIIARMGANPLEVIEKVEKKIQELKPLLPKGIEIIPAYNRAKLIKRAIYNVSQKLVEEMIVVALVTIVFLLHFRSSLVAIFTIPLGIMASLLTMYFLGISANIMSLGGIAIAIGVMVDSSVVMVENLHKHLENEPYNPKNFINVIKQSSLEVGPSLFFSLVIITLSFLPILLLKGESGKLFVPLALTKTFAMGYASIISVTVIPVFMLYFVKGSFRKEEENPISRFLIKIYKPILEYALEKKLLFISLSFFFVLLSIIPIIGIKNFKGEYFFKPIGGEFLPPLNEGDLLYMPTTLPGISITAARQLLQKTDELIKQVPEVDTVFGKIGRAETATDPAPLTMIETTIQLKPKSQWRKGMTIEKILEELDKKVQIPGIANAWTFPIRTRINMLSTGIKTPIGIKLFGNTLQQLNEVATFIEAKLKDFPGTLSVVSERATGGRYIVIKIKREEAQRYLFNIEDIQNHIQSLVGGMTVNITVEGNERYPIVIKYPRELIDSIDKLKNLWISLPTMTEKNQEKNSNLFISSQRYIPLEQVAEISIEEGPTEIKSENARKTLWIYIDLKSGYDIETYVKAAKEYLNESIQKKEIPFYNGMSIVWSGQYEQIEKSREQLLFVSVFTILSILFLLYLHFRNWTETILIFVSTSFALTGGIWLMYFLGYNRSVATDIGFIALAGLAAETGIVMLSYLDNAKKKLQEQYKTLNFVQIREAIMEGAVMRVRPKMMTVTTTMIGLIPILWSEEAGSEIMKRLAIPMIGGLFTSTILTLILIPILYELIEAYTTKKDRKINQNFL